MTTALVTGGAGFIGGHLVDFLLKQDWSVRVLDDFSSGSPTNLPSRGEVDIRRGDIRNAADCFDACKGVDYVFHMAALASVAASIDDPITSSEINVAGTLNVLAAARDQGVKRLVFSSSASVYGNAEAVPTSEDQPLDPQSPYATSKACGESYCRNFNSLYGIETVVLRYFNVFGPRQNVQSGYAAVIPAFITAALAGRAPIVYGDGLQTRDFVYVENAAQANAKAAVTPGAQGRAYNVGCGEEVSLLDLLRLLEPIAGVQQAPSFMPPRSGEARVSRADITRAARELDYAPTISLAEGLARTFDAYAQRPTVAPAG